MSFLPWHENSRPTLTPFFRGIRRWDCPSSLEGRVKGGGKRNMIGETREIAQQHVKVRGVSPSILYPTSRSTIKNVHRCSL